MFALKWMNPLLIRLTRLSALRSRTWRTPTSLAEIDGAVSDVEEREEQILRSAITDLPAAERQRRIERHKAYQQMVERQRLIEAGHESENDPWLWDWLGMNPPSSE